MSPLFCQIPSDLRPRRQAAAWSAACSVSLALWLCLSGARAQDQRTPAAPLLTEREALRETFLAEQMALAQERQSLAASGATAEQLQAWREANAKRFAVQERRAQRIARQAALDPRPLLPSGSAALPTGASSTLIAALTTRTHLANGRTRIHNQLVQAMPADATAEAVGQMQEQEAQVFAQEFGAEEARQVRQAQILADASAARLQPLAPPRPLPPGASPELAACLAAGDQLMREEVQLRNQYAGADPAVRDNALRQWREQNASRFQQWQAQMRALPPTP